MLGLQDQRLEYHHSIERGAPTLGTIAVAEPFNQPDAEVLEAHRILQTPSGSPSLLEAPRWSLRLNRELGSTRALHHRS